MCLVVGVGGGGKVGVRRFWGWGEGVALVGLSIIFFPLFIHTAEVTVDGCLVLKASWRGPSCEYHLKAPLPVNFLTFVWTGCPMLSFLLGAGGGGAACNCLQCFETTAKSGGHQSNNNDS